MTRDDARQLQAFMQGCFKYDGPYKLASGRVSKYYYDGKGATQDPVAAWLIGNAIVDVILESKAEAVGGLEIGAIPIADATALAGYVNRGIKLPTFIVRKEPKSHGNRSQVSEANLPDGSQLLTEGRRVAIVDDVITTGGSIQKAIDVVQGLGCVVTAVIALVERHESENKALRGQGFSVSRLFYTNEEGELFIDPDFARRAEATPESAIPNR